MILIYSDNKNNSLELLGKGRELADQVKNRVLAVIIGNAGEPEAKELIAFGADTVVIAETDMEHFKVEEYADILQGIINEYNCETVMIGSNKNGKELAPRLAAKLETGCVTDCINVSLEGEKLTVERIVFSGAAISRQQFASDIQILTIPPKAFDPPPKDEARTGEVIKKSYQPNSYASKVLRVQEMKSGDVNVEDAEIIVSCGRGLKKKEDIRLLEELAETLRGNTIGCSRPIAADLKWLSEDHWIGLSGHKVKPKLYIACGISGQIQHIAGMRDSAIIVAINRDSEAPIFKSADYGIVGDLYTVVPALTKAIKEEVSS